MNTKELAEQAGQHDMFTKSQNVDKSAERVHESDKSIHKEQE